MNYKISLDSIIDVDRTQIREAYDNGVIADLSLMFAEPPEDLEGEETDEADYYPPELPPIAVVPAPGDDSKYWIIDGHHRYKAAKATGKRMILADIRDSVKDLDALRYLQANCNGEAVANRTIETRRRQVKAAIKAEPKWYPFQIARYCHVSVDLVHSVFAELEAQKPKKPIEKAQEAIADPANAGKSNRQIAKAAGVDEETIRRAKKGEGKVRENSEPKNPAPETPEEFIEQHNRDYPDCANCGSPNIGDLIEYDWNGEKLYFCDEDCVEEFADKNGLEVDHVNGYFIEKDFDAQLDKVAAKARESVKAPVSDSIPIRDKSNIDSIVDDVLSWLGDRAEIFAVLLRERLDG